MFFITCYYYSSKNYTAVYKVIFLISFSNGTGIGNAYYLGGVKGSGIGFGVK